MFQKTKLTIIKDELETLLGLYVGCIASKNNLQFLTHDLQGFFAKHDMAEIQFIVQLKDDSVQIKGIRRIDELALITLAPKKYLERKEIF